jgi:hypothetical protein
MQRVLREKRATPATCRDERFIETNVNKRGRELVYWGTRHSYCFCRNTAIAEHDQEVEGSVRRMVIQGGQEEKGKGKRTKKQMMVMQNWPTRPFQEGSGHIFLLHRSVEGENRYVGERETGVHGGRRN